MPLIKVQLTEDEIKHMGPFQERCETSKVGYRVACEEIKASGKALWEELGKLHPGVGVRGADYFHEEGEGFITYFKEKE